MEEQWAAASSRNTEAADDKELCLAVRAIGRAAVLANPLLNFDALIFYALNSTGGSPIYRISGWNGWHRASGRVRLIAAETRVAKRNGTGLKGEYFNTSDCTGEPVLTRTDKLVFF